MKILITAFEPFDNNEVNYSFELLKELNEDENIKKLILPVEYFKSFEILKEVIEKEDLSQIILLGEARSYLSVGFEVIGINELSKRADNKGLISNTNKIIENGPDGLFSTLDFEVFKNSFNSVNVKFHRSYSVGTYVCNSLMYQTLLYLKETNKTKINCGFIHIPDLNNQDLKEIIKGFNNYLINLIKS